MAILTTRQITLTDAEDAGPFFDVYWSTDNGASYSLAIDGENVYLPSVGSTVIVSIPTTTTTIKLVSKGVCTTEFISGSQSGTTTTTSSTTSAPPSTTTTTSTTCVPSSSLDPILCGYDAGVPATACSQSVIVTAYKTGFWLDSSTVVYSTSNGCNVTPGFYAPLSGEEGAGSVFQVDQYGDVVGVGSCTSGTTTTTTLPTVYNVGYRTTSSSPISAFACGTVSPILYTNKSSYAQVGAGNGTRIYTDAIGTPLVGGDAWFGISPTTGNSIDTIKVNNSGYVTNDDPGRCTTTTTTSTTAAPTTTTTTAPPLTLTQVYSDTQPRYGNLSSCGCEGYLGLYNYAILGDYDIYSDLTGRTIYQDNVGNELFVGDNLWYCITDVEGTETTISIQIDNLGNITGWTDCSTTSTTTTTSTTSTTTSATGCYEYLVECRKSFGSCTVNYTDCFGNGQVFSVPADTGGVICAQPTPSITDGVVEFLGDCGLTTTTTTAAPTTTTTTAATTFPNMWTVQRCDGTPGSYKVSSASIGTGNAFKISTDFSGWYYAVAPTTGSPTATIISSIYANCASTPPF